MDLSAITKKIEEASREFYREKDVKVKDIMITLGLLGAEEEASIQDYVAPNVKIAYIYRLKLETVVRAIKAIDGQRLDTAEFVQTGDMIDGKPVSVERVKYFRDMFGKWGQSVIDKLFYAYAELVADLERELNPEKSEQEIMDELMAQVQLANALSEQTDNE